MVCTRLAVLFAVTLLTIGSKTVSGSDIDEDRGHLILEKLVKTDFPTVGSNLTVQLNVHNGGQGSAFEVQIRDTDYSPEDFEVVSGATEFTISKLESGESSFYEVVLKPKRSGMLPTKPASISYKATYNSEMLQTGVSTVMSEIQVLSHIEFYQSKAVTAGAYLSLGYCKSVGDWMRMAFTVGGILILYTISQLYSKVSKAMAERQRKKAMEALGVDEQ